ncbi:MAG: SpoIIE family protein phosphatase [Acidobacteriota bacterium]
MEKTLTITFPDGRTDVVSLQGNSWSVGRSGSNDLSCREDAGLSREHLVFERDVSGWSVRDLGSKNGTFVNGTRVNGRQPLHDGDRITASRLLVVLGTTDFATSKCSVIFDRAASDPAANTVSTSLQELISGQKRKATAAGVQVEDRWTDPLTAFLKVGRELSHGRPLAELFQVILDLSVEAVGAERGVLLTLEGEQLMVQSSRGDDFHISSTVRDRVVREKTSLLITDALSEESFRSMQSIVQQGVRSFMAVPLQTDERVIGLIYVDSLHSFRRFSEDDLNLLTVMANVAAIRIERERLALAEQARRRLAHELEQAAEIQRQILPAQAPEVPGLDLAGFNASCRTVGGDYYDFLTYRDGQVSLMVGDVCGKGMPAALIMMGLQARVQVLTESPACPAELAERLNRILSATSLGGRFISFFFANVNPQTGEMVYCNAGHNPPFLLRSDGEVELLAAGGPVLGILPDAGYERQRCQLRTGEAVVLFSDGVTEAVNPAGEEFGEDRLLQIVKQSRTCSARETLEKVSRAVDEWIGGQPAADDITLVVARRT